MEQRIRTKEQRARSKDKKISSTLVFVMALTGLREPQLTSNRCRMPNQLTTNHLTN
jgi:hypothetical protein